MYAGSQIQSRAHSTFFKKFDTENSFALDGLLAIVLKPCAPELAPVRLVSISYNCDIYSNGWRIVKIQVTPTTGSKFLLSFYRSTSIFLCIVYGNRKMAEDSSSE